MYHIVVSTNTCYYSENHADFFLGKNTRRNPGFDVLASKEDVLLEDVLLEDALLEDALLEDALWEDVLLKDVLLEYLLIEDLFWP